MAAELPPGIRKDESPLLFEMDDKTFERLCRDIFENEPLITTCGIYGVPGQTQDGIDLFAHRADGDVEVGQCKCHKAFPPAKIRAASDKFFESWETRWRDENVKRFVLFVASDLDKTQQQNEISKQKKRFLEYGIQYEAWSAATIRNKLRSHRGIVANYFDPPEYWVKIICGHVPQFVLPAPSTGATSATLDVLANQIEMSRELLSESADQELVALREILREGRVSDVQIKLENLRKDRTKRAILSPEIKAKYLCFEGSIELQLTGNSEQAEALADMASDLAPTPNEHRLRSFITFIRGDIKGALALLEGLDDPDSLHLKASLHLEDKNAEMCLRILQSENLESNQTAETYRLRALAYLVKKNISKAQLEIQKALELGASWESVKFTSALINYFSALTLDIYAGQLVISPGPVDWIIVKRDSHSLDSLRRAQEQLHWLSDSPEQTQDTIKRNRAWLLACLANDPHKQEDAASLCGLLLDEDPSFAPAIDWAIARNYSVDLEKSIEAITGLLEKGTVSIHQALALVSCHMAIDQLGIAMELLEDHEAFFHEKGANAIWLHMYTQILINQGDYDLAHEVVVKHKDIEDIKYIRVAVAYAVSRGSNNWSAFNNCVEELGDISTDLNLLLNISKFKADQQDWGFISGHADLLINNFPTAEVLRLVSIALYNTKQYELCLRHLDDHRSLFPGAKLPNQLRKIRILCLSFLGSSTDAISEAENLAGEDPSIENLLALLNLFAEQGNFERIDNVARQLYGISDIPPGVALQVARLLLWNNKRRSAKFWEKAMKSKIPDDLVVDAYALGNQLGKTTELTLLFKRLQKLGREGHQSVSAIDSENILENIQKIMEGRKATEKEYLSGNIPLHLYSQKHSVPLAPYYHYRFNIKGEGNIVGEIAPLLARHGARINSPNFPSGSVQWRLHLDITSAILAEELDIMPVIEQQFSPILIPQSLIPALIIIREKSTPHQPGRLDEIKQIYELFCRGTICIAGAGENNEQEDKSLIAEMGVDWASLAATAIKQKGYLVDYLPLTKKDLSGTPPSSLPENLEGFLIDCEAIIESLFREGPLSLSDYREALGLLGYTDQYCYDGPLPLQGSQLYCYGNILEKLTSIGLLHLACERFDVFVGLQTIKIYKTELDQQRLLNASARVIDDLIDRLSQGLEKNIYEALPYPQIEESTNEDLYRDDPIASVLASLLSFEKTKEAIIWADDRWVNSFLHRDGIPIIDVYDILVYLVHNNGISASDYYRALFALRRANVLFIPVRYNEIIFQLKQANITKDRTLVETQQLRTLRQYIATSFLQDSILQLEQNESDQTTKPSEKMYIVNSIREVSASLYHIWLDGDISPQDRPVLSEWILGELYMDNLILSRSTGIHGEDLDEDFFMAIGLVDLLSTPIFSGITKDVVPAVQAYYAWLTERILIVKFNSNPPLLKNVVEQLKRMFIESKDTPGETGSDMSAVAIEIMHRFYENLPPLVQRELQRDVDFMAEFGYEIERIIKIYGYEFGADTFYEPVKQAYLGHESELLTRQDQTRILLKPAEGEHEILFCHPDLEEQRISNEQFILFNDSPSSLEKELRLRNNWFDCSQRDLDNAIASIVVCKDHSERFGITEKWINSSVSVFYDKLFHSINETKKVDFSQLVASVELRYFDHFRFPQPLGGAENSFEETLAVSCEILLAEEDLFTTLERLVSFPTPLPQRALSALLALSETDSVSLIKQLLGVSGSPLSKIHLVRILCLLGDKHPSFYRLARRILKDLISSNGETEFAAFSALLSWVEQEFNRCSSTQEWGPVFKLAIVWAHAHNLFCRFTALGIPYDWITEQCSRLTLFINPDLFSAGFSSQHDASRPSFLSYPALILTGSAYSIGKHGGAVIDEVLEKQLETIAFHKEGGEIYPSHLVFRDISLAPNCLQVFLGWNYGETFGVIFNKEKAAVFNSEYFLSLANEALGLLSEKPNDLPSLRLLQLSLGFFPPYDQLKARELEILSSLQFTQVVDQNLLEGLHVMNFTAIQSVYLQNESLAEYIEDQFYLVVRHITEDLVDELKSAEISYIDEMTMLIEIALNISFFSESASERIARFSNLLSSLMRGWPETMPTIKPLVQRWCEELPTKQAQYLGNLLLQLRAVG